MDEWLRDHGPTDTDNLALVCGYHHHNFAGWGWRVEMRDGVPWWIPPADLDPDQKPLQNTKVWDRGATDQFRLPAPSTC